MSERWVILLRGTPAGPRPASLASEALSETCVPAALGGAGGGCLSGGHLPPGPRSHRRSPLLLGAHTSGSLSLLLSCPGASRGTACGGWRGLGPGAVGPRHRNPWSQVWTRRHGPPSPVGSCWGGQGGAAGPGRGLRARVPFHCAGCGLVADGRGVGLPGPHGQLAHLRGEVADGGGPVAARDPLELEAAGRHLGLGHPQLPGGRRPLCKQMRTDQGVRGTLKPPVGTATLTVLHGADSAGDSCVTGAASSYSHSGRRAQCGPAPPSAQDRPTGCVNPPTHTPPTPRHPGARLGVTPRLPEHHTGLGTSPCVPTPGRPLSPASRAGSSRSSSATCLGPAVGPAGRGWGRGEASAWTGQGRAGQESLSNCWSWRLLILLRTRGGDSAA